MPSLRIRLNAQAQAQAQAQTNCTTAKIPQLLSGQPDLAGHNIEAMQTSLERTVGRLEEERGLLAQAILSLFALSESPPGPMPAAPPVARRPTLCATLDALVEHARRAQKAIAIRLERWRFDLQRLFNWAPSDTMPDFSPEEHPLDSPPHDDDSCSTTFPFAARLRSLIRDIALEYTLSFSFLLPPIYYIL